MTSRKVSVWYDDEGDMLEVLWAFREGYFTPTYSSWMNLVERWFAELTTKWLRRGAHRSVADLTRDVERWVDDWNEHPRPFVWHQTADQIFDNLAGYLNRIPDSGH